MGDGNQNFRMNGQAFARAFATVAVLVTSSHLLPGTALAKDSNFDSAVDGTRSEMKEIEKDNSAVKKRLAESEDKVKKLSSPTNRDPAYLPKAISCDDACTPNKMAGCSPGDLEMAGIVDPTMPTTATTASSANGPTVVGGLSIDPALAKPAEPASPPARRRGGMICLDLYKFDPALNQISATCAAQVRKCGPIAKQLVIEDFKQDVIDCKETIKSNKERLAELARDLRDIQKQCPNCAMIDAMKPREPGVGDYLIAGLQGITPMVLGGFNMMMYNNGLNSYEKNYQGYLQQCTTVGIPCGGPGFYGGSVAGYGGGGFGGGYMMGGMGGGMMGGMGGGGIFAGAAAGIFAGGGGMMGGMGGGGIFAGAAAGIFAGGGGMMGGGMMGGMYGGGGGMMLYPQMPMTAGYGVPMYGYGGGFGSPIAGGGFGGGIFAGVSAGIFGGGGGMMGGGGFGGGMMGGMYPGGMYGGGGGGGYMMVPVPVGGYGYPGGGYGGGGGIFAGVSAGIFGGGGGMMGGMYPGGGMYPSGGMMYPGGGGGFYPGGGGGMYGGGYPIGYPGGIGGGIGGGMYPGGIGGGGFGYPAGGYNGYGNAGIGYGMPGIGGGMYPGGIGGGYGYPGGMYGGGGGNSQYYAMQQAQLAAQQQKAAAAAQAQNDLMIAQQQIYEAQQKYYQALSGGGGYGGGGIGGYGGGARPL